MTLIQSDFRSDQHESPKLLLVETVYNLADAIADSANAEDSEARKKREAAINRLEELLQTAHGADDAAWPFDPANAWILDVLGDLAQYARSSGYERTYAKLVACHAWIVLTLAK